METTLKTDWDAYYSRPAGLSPFTRRITVAKVLRLLDKALPQRGYRSVVELGGGNSCIYSAVSSRFQPEAYHIVDNNAVGLAAFRRNHPKGKNAQLTEGDIRAPLKTPFEADACISIGLIEHFDVAGTALVVQRHFEAVRAGSIVLITFPTPTLLYRAVRWAAEFLGVWKFPDERPLSFEEVRRAAAPHGTVLYEQINWPIGLTQGLVLFRKHGSSPFS
jgi:hypothetical protein